jgi:hypothetical protein
MTILLTVALSEYSTDVARVNFVALSNSMEVLAFGF